MISVLWVPPLSTTPFYGFDQYNIFKSLISVFSLDFSSILGHLKIITGSVRVSVDDFGFVGAKFGYHPLLVIEKYNIFKMHNMYY